MYPEHKTLTMAQWNKLMDSGDVIDVTPADKPKRFLMVYQIFVGEVAFIGKTWRATAWAPPGGKPYVTLEEIIDGTFKVEEAPFEKGKGTRTCTAAEDSSAQENAS